METEMITLEINGKSVEVPKGTSILNAAKAAHIKIPTLCYHPDLKPGASCGICVVRQLVPSRTEPGKFVPSPKLLRACTTEAAPGMKMISSIWITIFIASISSRARSTPRSRTVPICTTE